MVSNAIMDSLFEESLQVAYAKMDKYTPRDWRMYNEGKDSSYTDGYNQGLLEGHDSGWDEAKEYYQKIFQRELRETKQQWKEEGVENKYCEGIDEKYEESEVDSEWSAYGQKTVSNYTRSWNWFEDWPMMSLGMPSSVIGSSIWIGQCCSNADYKIIVLDV
jgi:flagellar biosynthesis/type III secretory pathway protein FliH